MQQIDETQRLGYFWFRRDLRLEDNTALFHALSSGKLVQPIFIFDHHIISQLEEDDARISFIYQELKKINEQLNQLGSSLQVLFGNPLDILKELLSDENIDFVYFNHDYEPYAIDRDNKVKDLAHDLGVECRSFKDQVIFEEGEILKADGTPYTVFTPYKRRWLEHFDIDQISTSPGMKLANLCKSRYTFPPLEELGFKPSKIQVPDFDISVETDYEATRNFPSLNGTSQLSTHLRFGTISIREIIRRLKNPNGQFLSELIWREFFMQILWHFPRVVTTSFKKKYDNIHWSNDEANFAKWCEGNTGYPMVDAGMRELNQTGLMHNRVRMVTASFLCKHLLIDWRWGEAYFAEKLLDYELSSNNGNWQWAAGSGCDAAPYFRVFNPTTQQTKFDPEMSYIKKWIPEIGSSTYPSPMIDHKMARDRALEVYKSGLER